MIHARTDYDRIQDPANLIPADEPVFLIRAKDMNGPDAVRAWAEIAEQNGAEADIVEAARSQARRMHEWQMANGYKIPDVPDGCVRT